MMCKTSQIRSAGGVVTAAVIVVASLIAVAALIFLLQSRRAAARGPGKPLLVYCAAGIKPPVEAVARAYEQEFGVAIQLQYGGSGTLLSGIRLAKTGDLFIAADASYIRLGREQGVIAEAIPLAWMHPVIAVRAGNPKQIRTVADLLRPDVAVALANPEAASIGKATRTALQAAGTWAALESHVRVFKPTVNDVANDVKLGTVDAGIVWNATARQYPELQIVDDASLTGAVETVTLGVLGATRQPAAALHFARYLAARDRGLPLFARHHYDAVAGDAWADVPEIVLFSGSMLRPGVEAALKDFEAREGVRITTVYNGCGILCAQMRAGQRPDAYFACDTSFMNTVAELYVDSTNVVDNDLMLIVAKGNPLGLKTPADLLRPGLRVGLPHHEKSAMGNIAWKLLVDLGLYDQLGANMKVESPTGDFLINQIRTGSLDVIIACRSNLTASRGHLDGIPIDHPLARMTQPYAVGKASLYPHLMTRLREAILTPASRQRFESAGFRWLGAQP